MGRNGHLSDLDLRQTLAHSLIGQDKAYLPHMFSPIQIRDVARCLWALVDRAWLSPLFRQALFQLHRVVHSLEAIVLEIRGG